MKVRFILKPDRGTVVAFEPTATQYRLEAGEEMVVVWHGGREDGTIELVGNDVVVHAPSEGYTRAWNGRGQEVFVGLESDEDSVVQPSVASTSGEVAVRPLSAYPDLSTGPRMEAGGVGLRFILKADRGAVVVFEPSAAEHFMEAAEELAVVWHGGREDGTIELVGNDVVVHAPSEGYTRAWNAKGQELYVSLESGENSVI
ncbi:hypothetical protein AB0I60_03180 [Actinosynnema sp. NPDC050436]|uniref:hypothetical protein n=1 Tax=Actinosynnema sp. NPDC050436 TaxID=3155659 RepID=UPI0033E9893C